MRYLAYLRCIFLYFNKLSFKKLSTSFLVTSIFILVYNLAYSFQLTLEWSPNDEPDLAGYKIYYGTECRNYTFDADVGDYESVTISDLEPGKKYYFAVTAYDLNGNESDFSKEISYPVSMPWIPLLLLDD